jgi:putative SOS response-associated peptidase YedK
MTPLTITIAASQTEIFRRLGRDNRWRSPGRQLADWPAGLTARAGESTPYLRFHGATVEMATTIWGWPPMEEGGPFRLTQEAEGRRFGRTALLPVSSIEIAENGRVFRMTRYDQAFFFAAAAWVPISQHSFEPGAVALLTTPAGPQFHGLLSRTPIDIPDDYCRQFLDPAVETLSLQGPAHDGTFEIEVVDAAVA